MYFVVKKYCFILWCLFYVLSKKKGPLSSSVRNLKIFRFFYLIQFHILLTPESFSSRTKLGNPSIFENKEKAFFLCWYSYSLVWLTWLDRWMGRTLGKSVVCQTTQIKSQNRRCAASLNVSCLTINTAVHLHSWHLTEK